MDRLEAGDRQALKAAEDDGIIALWVQIDIMADRGVGAAAILLTAGAHRPALRLLGASWRVLPPGRAGELVALTRGAEAAVAAGADVLAASAALATPAFAMALLAAATLSTLRAASCHSHTPQAEGLCGKPTAPHQSVH